MLHNRIPPQDIDTEVACISAVLLNREALYKVTEILHPDDFYLDKNRIIYQAIIELEKKNLPVDLATLKQILSDINQLDKIGGDSGLVEIYQSSSTSANAEFYAKRIKELSIRRKLIEVSSDNIDKCFDMSFDTDELIDTIEKDIFNITEKRITSDFQHIISVIDETMETIGKWVDTKKIVTGISTGFKDLDEILTGFHESELIIIAARPGMGKTALALNILNHIALKEEKAVLFFSLEMPAVQLAMRMLCIESMINSQHVRTGHLSSEDLKNLFKSAEKFHKCPIYIDDTPSTTILQMRAKARRMAKNNDLGAIIVDYLQLISGPSGMERHQQIAEISRFLKQLSRDLSVPVVALSQLSRAVESRVDQMPTLADLRESGAIEQDADVVLFIYREEKVKKDTQRLGEADIIIAKQRNGPVGTIPLMFWQEYTKFSTKDKTHSFDEAVPSREF